MDFHTWLQISTNKLDEASINSARLDCILIAEDILKKDRTWLLANPDYPCKGPALSLLNKAIKRRGNHEPLAYIRGKSEFYGREFYVTPATLQPRPETETMIELLLNLVERKKLKVKSVVDVGTGSGCIAITAKKELPKTQVYATEINQDALKVAKKNAKKLKADIAFYKGNLLEPIMSLPEFRRPQNDWILLCNLPYVPDGFNINKAARQEPQIAIFGGEHGLTLYEEMFEQIDALTKKPQHIFTECLPPQHQDLAKIAKESGYKLQEKQDLIQHFERS